MGRNATNTIQAVVLGCAASCVALAILCAGLILARSLVRFKGCRTDRYGLDMAIQDVRESRAAIAHASRLASAYSDLAINSPEPISRRKYAELSERWQGERRLLEERCAESKSDVKSALMRLIRYERAEIKDQ